MGQFNKQNPAQWLNNLAMAKNRGGMRGGPNMMGGPNQMGHMMGGPMGPNMGPMGHSGMGHMGPNMMGHNRMSGPGNQMMMMKGGPGQMGQMGPGMGPMDGFPGGTPSCGVMDGLGADGEMPWDTVSIYQQYNFSFQYFYLLKFHEINFKQYYLFFSYPTYVCD